MSSRRRPKHTGALVAIALSPPLLVIIKLLASAQPPGNAVSALIRAVAMSGYLYVFLSIVSTPYVRELVLYFGRPFIKVHHMASITGLALITLHPILVALRGNSFSIVLPRLLTIHWYLFALAALAAVFRSRLRDFWRWIHWLNYLAFVFATLHLQQLGTDTQSLPIKVLTYLMAAAVIGVLVVKRVTAARLAAKRRARVR